MGKSSKNMSADERYAHMMDACVAHGSARAVVCAFSGCQGWTGGFEEEMAGKLAEQQIALLAVPLIDLKYTKPAAQNIFPVSPRADQEDMLKSFEHAADIIQMVFLHYGTRAIFVGISQGADLLLGGMRELRRRRLAVGARGLLQVQAPVFLFGGGHYAYSVDALNVAGDAGADSADTLNVPWRPSPQWLRDMDMELRARLQTAFHCELTDTRVEDFIEQMLELAPGEQLELARKLHKKLGIKPLSWYKNAQLPPTPAWRLERTQVPSVGDVLKIAGGLLPKRPVDPEEESCASRTGDPRTGESKAYEELNTIAEPHRSYIIHQIDGEDGQLKCNLCDKVVWPGTDFQTHMNSKRHKKQIEYAAQNERWAAEFRFTRDNQWAAAVKVDNIRAHHSETRKRQSRTSKELTTFSSNC